MKMFDSAKLFWTLARGGRVNMVCPDMNTGDVVVVWEYQITGCNSDFLH